MTDFQFKHRSLTCRLYPTQDQETLFRKFSGCSRFVYNKGLAEKNKAYLEDGTNLSYFDLNTLLVGWKKQPEMEWLKEVNAQTLQLALFNLTRAYTNFFRGRAAHPKFKKKSQGDRFQFQQGVVVEHDLKRVYLPKIGWVKVRGLSRSSGLIKRATVSRKADQWHISILAEVPVETKPCMGPGVIAGLDLGVVSLATVWDGAKARFYNEQTRLPELQQKLAIAQKKLSRKQKGSKNRGKARMKVAKLHLKMANIRHNRAHQVTTHIATFNEVVVMEDLRVKNMSKSAKGTLESPGKNVAQKAGLNRAILNQSWGAFEQMLSYKLADRNGQLLLVDPKNTSRTCPGCGHCSKDNRKSQAVFDCVHCGYTNNADIVGAMNIRDRGLGKVA